MQRLNTVQFIDWPYVKGAIGLSILGIKCTIWKDCITNCAGETVLVPIFSKGRKLLVVEDLGALGTTATNKLAGVCSVLLQALSAAARFPATAVVDTLFKAPVANDATHATSVEPVGAPLPSVGTYLDSLLGGVE